MAEPQLKKNLSPLNVWALAFGCIIGFGAFMMPGNTFLIKAGPLGTAIAMAVAAVLMIIIAFNYYFMINHYPVAGGEFTYTQKSFGTTHAFICSWFLGLSYIAIVPLNATALGVIGRNLLNGVFQIGFHYKIAGYDIYFGEILLAAVALIFLAFLGIRGVKFTGVFQTGLAFALISCVLIVVVAAAVSPKVSFSNLEPAFYPGNSKISGILAVVAVAPWAFVGFDTIPQASEEFKFSHKKTKAIMCISILFGALAYIALNTVTAVVVPDGYENWAQYIEDLPNLDGIMSLPTFNAARVLLGNWGVALLGIAVLAATISSMVGFYMATSRLLYSMSKEKVLPAWFGKLHPKYKTPANSIVFILLLSLIAPFFGRTALGWIVDMSSVGAAIGYAYTSAAAVKLAVKEKNKGIVVTGILGIMLALMFVILLLVPIPMFDCSLGKESYICFGVWTVLGIVFYVFSRKKKNSVLTDV